MEKDLCTLRVVVDDEPTMDSKDMGRRSQIAVSKVKENEASEIETLTRLLNSLTIELTKLKKQMTETTVSSRPPRFA